MFPAMSLKPKPPSLQGLRQCSQLPPPFPTPTTVLPVQIKSLPFFFFCLNGNLRCGCRFVFFPFWTICWNCGITGRPSIASPLWRICFGNAADARQSDTRSGPLDCVFSLCSRAKSAAPDMTTMAGQLLAGGCGDIVLLGSAEL